MITTAHHRAAPHAPDPGVPAGAVLRCVRAALFALVCTGLAVCGHALAGGPSPSAAYVASGFGGVFATAAVLLGRERGFALIAGGLLAGQFGLHAWFMRAHAAAPGSGMDGMAMHTMHSMPPEHLAIPDAPGLSGWMVLAHVLAAGASGGYLWFGESRLWALIRLAGHHVSWSALRRSLACRDAVVLTEPSVRPAAPVRHGRVRWRRWLVTRVVSWRGPPYAGAF